MKRKLLLSLGVLCAFGIYSCQKTGVRETNTAQSEELVANAANTARLPTEPLEPSTVGPFSEISYSHEASNVFTEGPAVDKFGNVFFTDQNHDKIYRWDALTGKVTLFLDSTHSGRSNGMAFDRDGSLIACADMHGELWSIDKFGNHKILVDNYNGKLLNGPNDVWINPKDRGMYITDPMFPRPYWDHDFANNNVDPRYLGNWNGNLVKPGTVWPPKYSEQGPGIAGHVYYLAPGSSNLVRVTTMDGWNPQTSFPNGVVGTPDGKKLYVNKWAAPGGPGGQGGIWVFDINKDGTLSNMKPFVPVLYFCDGMSLDEFGNVYVSAQGGVRIYNPDGIHIKTISTSATNNVFAGLDQKTLFITGGGNGKIYTQKMNVRGVEKFGGEHFGQTK
jgi:gluconolactonase